MTDDTAARLRALAQAAPKGPWTLLGAPDDAAPHLWTIVTADGLWTAREPVAEFHRLLPEARALQAAAGRYIAAASPDAILALLDALDEARRKRDELRINNGTKHAQIQNAADEVSRLRRERDAAVALLREAQHAIALAGYGSRMAPEVADTIRRIDALLGGGEG